MKPGQCFLTTSYGQYWVERVASVERDRCTVEHFDVKSQSLLYKLTKHEVSWFENTFEIDPSIFDHIRELLASAHEHVRELVNTIPTEESGIIREVGTVYLYELYEDICLNKIVDKRKDSEGNIEEVVETLKFDPDICSSDTVSDMDKYDRWAFLFPASSLLFDKAKRIILMNTDSAWTVCSHLYKELEDAKQHH